MLKSLLDFYHAAAYQRVFCRHKALKRAESFLSRDLMRQVLPVAFFIKILLFHAELYLCSNANTA